MSGGIKKYNTIGCCGIDCGLCPRFISESESACPGCGGVDFYNKHPACGFLTCCAKKRELEVCGECDDYPCQRFDSEKEGYDSFVTHKKVFHNQDQVRSQGLDGFLIGQNRRIEILKYLVEHFDNGRSKSFFCQACALLPVESLNEIYQDTELTNESMDLKQRNQIIKEKIQKMAERLDISLKLRKK